MIITDDVKEEKDFPEAFSIKEDLDVYRILDSFTKCDKTEKCDECMANVKIPGSTISFCDLLHQYAYYIENKISEIIHK